MTSYNGTPGIITVSGRFFEFLDPKPEQICIEDIAHALSMICRFAGHTWKFYSVAEHSVRVSQVCDPSDALWGLLHDAAEAYMVDMPAPLKRVIPAYRKIEARVQAEIMKRFGLPHLEPGNVKWADGRLLATEARDLCAPEGEFRGLPEKPLPLKITPVSQWEAEDWFFDRFAELFSELEPEKQTRGD